MNFKQYNIKKRKKNNSILKVFFFCFYLVPILGQETDCTNDFIYKTEKKAAKAIDQWGKFLIKSDSIHFVAIIKKKECNHYEFEIGNNSTKDFDINLYLKDNFSCLKLTKKLRLYRTASHRLKKKTRSLFLKKDSRPEIAISDINSITISTVKSNKFNLDTITTTDTLLLDSFQGGMRIGSKCKSPRRGVLGCVFQLKKFPGEYFGLSNAHVLGNHTGIKLGNPMIYPAEANQDNPINHHGFLFWENLSFNRDAAIVHLDITKKKIKTVNTCNININSKINKPILNDSVKICKEGGVSSHIIYSNNATVKLEDTRLPDNLPYFTNQILLHNIVPPGYSGSCLHNNSNNVIGLVTGFNDTHQYSVASNINYIFNYKFKQPQCYLINGKKEHISILKLNKNSLIKNY